MDREKELQMVPSDDEDYNDEDMLFDDCLPVSELEPTKRRKREDGGLSLLLL